MESAASCWCGKWFAQTRFVHVCKTHPPTRTNTFVTWSSHRCLCPLLPLSSSAVLSWHCCWLLLVVVRVVVCTVFFFLCFDRPTSLNKSRWPPKHTNRPRATKRPHSTLPKKESTWKRFFCLSSCRGSVHQLIFPFC